MSPIDSRINDLQNSRYLDNKPTNIQNKFYNHSVATDDNISRKTTETTSAYKSNTSDFFKEINNMANESGHDQAETNGILVTKIDNPQSYINEQPVKEASTSTFIPTYLSSLTNYIDEIYKKGDDDLINKINQILYKHGKLPLHQLRFAGRSLSITESLNIFEILQINEMPGCMKSYQEGMESYQENLRKRQHSDESDESTNKKTKPELTTKIVDDLIIIDTDKRNIQTHSGNMSETIDNQPVSEQPSIINGASQVGRSAVMSLSTEKTDVATEQTDVAKLLQTRKDILTREWQEMFLSIINQQIKERLQELQQSQQKLSLLGIMEIYINKCIENDSDFEDKQLSLKCNKNTAEVDKLTLLFYLVIKKKFILRDSGVRAAIKYTTAYHIIEGFKKCTPNIYILLESYKIYTNKKALTVKNSAILNGLLEITLLFRQLNKVVETVDEMQAFNLMSEHIDSDIKDLYKIALQREQDRK